MASNDKDSYNKFKKFLNHSTGSNNMNTNNGTSVNMVLRRSKKATEHSVAESRSFDIGRNNMSGFRDLIPKQERSLNLNQHSTDHRYDNGAWNSKKSIEGSRKEEWKKNYRCPPINFSEIAEEDSVNASSRTASPYNKHTFEPNEITGRSTTNTHQKSKVDFSNFSPSTADILATSFADDIREMCSKMNISSIGGSTAGIVHSPKQLMDISGTFSFSKNASLPGEKFVPSDEMKSQMIQDEQEWQNEYGDLPANASQKSSKFSPDEQSRHVSKETHRKRVNLTEFSGYLGETPMEENSAMSMGNYFLKRCEDIRQMIPNRSPPKNGAVGLLGESMTSGTETNGDTSKYSQVSTSFYTDDELKIKSIPRVNNATYDKKNPSRFTESILSVSDIAARLSEDTMDSPRTFLDKLYKKKKSKADDKKEESPILQPIGDDIRYITEAMPLPQNGPHSDKVQILNVEKFHGKTPNWKKIMNAPTTTNIITNPRKGQPTKAQSTASPKMSKNMSVENQNRSYVNVKNWIDNKENHNLTDATLSFSESALEMSDANADLSSMKDEHSPIKRNKVFTRKHSSPLENAAINLQVSSNKRLRSPLDPPAGSNKPTPNVPDLQVNGAPMAGYRYTDSPIKNGQSVAQKYNESGNVSKNDSNYSPPRHRAQHVVSSPSGASVARSSSQCSTNSEFTQRDGKFPLKANKRQLSWDCTKLRTNVSKSFIIKNSATKRLSLKIEVTGPGFQITGTESSLVLQGNECRTITVTFCPTVIGKAIGRVCFKPSRNWPEERTVHLYGYGGSTSLMLRGVERGPVGIAFLKMADTDNIQSKLIERSFKVYNKGPLDGFAVVTVKPESNQHLQDHQISISPSKCIIAPDSSTTITVTYKLRRKDLEKLRSCEVLTLATLEVITGADPNRHRVVNLLLKYHQDATAYRSLGFLIEDFPRIPLDIIKDFDENMETIGDLFNSFKSSDIAITINRNTLDETRDTCSDLSVDDSLFFRTLAPMNETIKHYSNKPDRSSENGRHVRRLSGESWSVWPKRLVVDQMNNAKQTIIIKNNFYTEQTFQIDSNNRHLFSFSTQNGRIKPGSECAVDVIIKKNVHLPSDTSLTVYIESDCIQIPVQMRSMNPNFNV